MPTRQSTETSDNALPTTPSHPRRFADAVAQYAQCTAANSLFPGSHFKPLAAYLQQPFDIQASKVLSEEVKTASNRDWEFVTLYDMNPHSRTKSHLKSIGEFESQATRLKEQSEYGQILFMRGRPSPEWLLAIGTLYCVDPVFFYHHLDVQRAKTDYFAFPSLPSTLSTIATLRVTTIGDTGSDAPPSKENQRSLEALRDQYDLLLNSYLDKFQDNFGNDELGESIIRDCSVYDNRHFAIEQDISVWANKTDKAWIAIIWLDNGYVRGNEPLLRPTDPSLPDSQTWLTRYLPVIQHKRYAAFNSTRYKNDIDASVSSEQTRPTNQSSSLLHLNYGHELDPQAASRDAFYSLNEIFRFAAFSESQFLNMIRLKLSEELSQKSTLKSKNLNPSNMFYYQRSLERHIERLTENVKAIRKTNWPGQSPNQVQKDSAAVASKALLHDYEDLLVRAKDLYKRCDKGVQTMISSTSIQESRNAIIQAEEVTKLTRLAFFFIPLSFLTSFFGMNFEELGTGALPLWIWFASAVPVILIVPFFMGYDLRRRAGRFAIKAFPSPGSESERESEGKTGTFV